MKNRLYLGLLMFSLLFVLSSKQANAQCTHTFNMYDSYGDGWNGASFTSGDQSVTLSEGSEGSVLLCFDLSVANDFTVGGGSWDSEITWTLDCADGNPLSGGAPYNGCVGAGCSEEPSCEDQWDACVSSLVDDYPEYWEACRAEDCD